MKKRKLVPREINQGAVLYDVERAPIEYWTLKQLIDYYIKIFIDESFQRPYCWSPKEVISWVNSILFNRIPSIFTIADNQSCADWCDKITPLLSDSSDYFKNIIEVHKCPSTSIDGNGRTTSTVGFFVPKADWPKQFPRKLYGNEQYEFTFPKGFKPSVIGFDDDGNEVSFNHSWKKREKLPFANFPEELKIIILNRKVLVSKLIRATQGDCHNEFIDLNKQHKITAQEDRQAYPSDYSNYVRNFTKLLFWIPTKVPKLTIQGRKIDEFVHICMVYITEKDKREEHIASKASLNEAYKFEASLTEINMVPAKTILNNAFRIKKEQDSQDILKEIHIFFNWIMYYVYCIETNQKIHSEARLFELFLAVHRTLWKDKKTLWYIEKKQQPFSQLCTSYRGIKILPRLNAIIKKMTKLLSKPKNIDIMTMADYGVKDPNRLFNRIQKEELWFIQGGVLSHIDKKGNVVKYKDAICPKTKKKIPYREIHDATRWGGDHYPIKWTDNGPTTVENGRLIWQSANKSDGCRPANEIPYKPNTQSSEMIYV